MKVSGVENDCLICFKEDSKFFPQVYLHKCFYEL